MCILKIYSSLSPSKEVEKKAKKEANAKQVALGWIVQSSTVLFSQQYSSFVRLPCNIQLEIYNMSHDVTVEREVGSSFPT